MGPMNPYGLEMPYGPLPGMGAQAPAGPPGPMPMQHPGMMRPGMQGAMPYQPNTGAVIAQGIADAINAVAGHHKEKQQQAMNDFQSMYQLEQSGIAVDKVKAGKALQKSGLGKFFDFKKGADQPGIEQAGGPDMQAPGPMVGGGGDAPPPYMPSGPPPQAAPPMPPPPNPALQAIMQYGASTPPPSGGMQQLPPNMGGPMGMPPPGMPAPPPDIPMPPPVMQGAPNVLPGMPGTSLPGFHGQNIPEPGMMRKFAEYAGLAQPVMNPDSPGALAAGNIIKGARQFGQIQRQLQGLQVQNAVTKVGADTQLNLLLGASMGVNLINGQPTDPVQQKQATSMLSSAVRAKEGKWDAANLTDVLGSAQQALQAQGQTMSPQMITQATVNYVNSKVDATKRLETFTPFLKVAEEWGVSGGSAFKAANAVINGQPLPQEIMNAMPPQSIKQGIENMTKFRELYPNMPEPLMSAMGPFIQAGDWKGVEKVIGSSRLPSAMTQSGPALTAQEKQAKLRIDQQQLLVSQFNANTNAGNLGLRAQEFMQKVKVEDPISLLKTTMAVLENKGIDQETKAGAAEVLSQFYPGMFKVVPGGNHFWNSNTQITTGKNPVATGQKPIVKGEEGFMYGTMMPIFKAILSGDTGNAEPN